MLRTSVSLNERLESFVLLAELNHQRLKSGMIADALKVGIDLEERKIRKAVLSSVFQPTDSIVRFIHYSVC